MLKSVFNSGRKKSGGKKSKRSKAEKSKRNGGKAEQSGRKEKSGRKPKPTSSNTKINVADGAAAATTTTIAANPTTVVGAAPTTVMGGLTTMTQVGGIPSPGTESAWANDPAAKKLLQQNVFHIATPAVEFAAVPAIAPSPEFCAGFFQNPTKNRNAQLPINEEHRVKLQNPAGGYINAAKITSPSEPTRTHLIGQIPELTELEEFWRMVFDENVTSVFFGFVAAFPLTLASYLPVTTGAFATHGKMFLNAKKVETIGKETTAITIELLPDGCSNSNMVTIYNNPNWAIGKAPGIISDCAAICEKISKANDGILFCSWNGVGRAGTMLMMYCVMSHVVKNVDLKICELFVHLRKQRFGIVENAEQYLAIYQAIGYWIKSKTNDPENIKQLAEFCAQLQ